jgi:hypothetical protein
MKINKTYILLGVFVLLVLTAYLITHEGGEKTTSYEIEGEKLFELDSALIDKIEIEQGVKKIVLNKMAVEWRITSPIDYNAYQQFINSMLSDLKNYTLESIVSDNPDKKETYGFNDSIVVKISIYQGNELMGSFLVGNASSGPSQTYIKNVEGDEIFLADGLLRNNFVKDNLDDWRDKLILSIPKGNVNSIEFITPEESYTAERDSTGKFYVGKDSVSSVVFDGILNLLQNFNTQRFQDTVLSKDTDFDKKVKVNWGKLTEINFLKLPDTLFTNYYIKVTDNDQIFEVDEGFTNNLFKSRKEITDQN